MKTRLFLTAAVMSVLACAAHAQTATDPQSQPSAAPAPNVAGPGQPGMPAHDAQGDAVMGGAVANPPMDPAMGAPSAMGAGADVAATVTTTTVTNGPIADTPENRAKYGQPMSRAGKASKARGN
ncbi:hypothetical protein [Phenylobacterium conjunctum]|uniref:Uncharacterized protein n=1 Tax=Phenylobacterium conjunctum TaxID=1298959 RepID=A0ABW3T099_9CAUL